MRRAQRNILDDVQDAHAAVRAAEGKVVTASASLTKASAAWETVRQTFWNIVGPPPLRLFWAAAALDWRRVRRERHHNAMDALVAAMVAGVWGFLILLLTIAGLSTAYVTLLIVAAVFAAVFFRWKAKRLMAEVSRNRAAP